MRYIPKKNKTAGWYASVGGNGSVGKRSGGGGNGSFNLSTKKIDFTTNASYSQKTQVEQGYQNRDLYKGADKIGDFKQDVDFSDNKVKNTYLNTGLSYHINNKNTIGAEFGFTKVTYNGLGDVNSQISIVDQRLLTSSRNNIKYAADLFNYNLKYKADFDSLGSNLIILGSYVKYKNDKTQIFEQSQLDQNSNTTTNSKIRNFAPADFNIYTLSADYTKMWSKELFLEGGVKYTYTSNQSKQITDNFSNSTWNTNDDGISEIGYYEKVSAAYLNLNYVLSQKTSFQAGIRGENTSFGVINNIHDSYFRLFPNLRLDYKWNTDFSSSIGYARNISRPAYEKLIPFELYIDNYTTQRGNPLLKPEYANSFFLNQIYKDYSLRVGYTITNDAISDLYLYDPASLRFTATQMNFLKSHLLSASLDVPLKLTSRWNANIGINGFYKDLKFPSALNPAIVMKKSKYYYTVSAYNAFSFKHNWSAELNFYYYSSFFDGLYDIGGFSDLSAGIKKTFWKNRASLKFDVSDIFYDSNMIVRTNELPTISTSVIKRDTRRFRVTFRYNFSGKRNVKSKILKNNGNDPELSRLGI
ncbi:outer membrane beta-barrel family protein [Pedobacter lusitanus]|uniref:outer membrane beta-barrel family protein n=1 Tax=Pedobacter lusitanus TaxID=1503925 RepID=UPI0005A4BBEE|nr:outer membrane beta-barrel family protein [Pedobacter lusitanus]